MNTRRRYNPHVHIYSILSPTSPIVVMAGGTEHHALGARMVVALLGHCLKTRTCALLGIGSVLHPSDSTRC